MAKAWRETAWQALWASRRLMISLAGPLRSARELGFSAPAAFRRDRAESGYREVFSKEQPLVSICIATYNRAHLLLERSLRSALAQTYPNLEIIVVGDCCTDETLDMMGGIKDERVRFLNRSQRGHYPEDPSLRWMVAGTDAINDALRMARGDFITHLDDDDEHAPERTEALLRFAQAERCDIVYHPFFYETENGDWRVKRSSKFAVGEVTTSSIFYHRYFQRIEWDPCAYIYREPGDWNRLRKIRFIGARALRHPGIFLRHYRERGQAG